MTQTRAVRKQSLRRGTLPAAATAQHIRRVKRHKSAAINAEGADVKMLC